MKLELSRLPAMKSKLARGAAFIALAIAVAFAVLQFIFNSEEKKKEKITNEIARIEEEFKMFSDSSKIFFHKIDSIRKSCGNSVSSREALRFMEVGGKPKLALNLVCQGEKRLELDSLENVAQSYRDRRIFFVKKLRELKESK